jgi:YidC/Oxa1 family membrane protein insertase
MISLLKTIIYYPLYNLLIFLAWLVPGHSLGWAIILMTLIIRLILLSPSIKAARAQVRMQMLQPEMARIKKEIKDQQEQGKALMALYKKEGVSPFGSCLPLLIQLPIIFILYRVFLNINRYGLNFENLYSFTPHMNSVNSFFFGLNLAKPELWVLPILAGASQFILSKMMLPPVPKIQSSGDSKPDMGDTMAMANKQMVYIFPLITVFIARSLPAGIGIYWIITTLFGIAQQYYVIRTIKGNPEEKREAIEDARQIESQYGVDDVETEEIEKPKKPDMVTKMMKKRLDKQEKKTGVEVVIRKKQ